MDDAEQLLPVYLRFVRGVVDVADLPLNVSREILQESKDIEQIRSGCTKRVLGLLEEMAEEGFSLSDEDIVTILKAFHDDNVEWLKLLLANLSEADIADLFQKIDREDRQDFLKKHANLIDPAVYARAEPSRADQRHRCRRWFSELPGRLRDN